MDDLKKNIGSVTTSSCIHVIKVNLSTFNSWILDTDFGSQICTNVQGLKRSRILAKAKVDLWVGNRARVVALAVGTYDLTLPSGLILSLENCYYVLAISRISFLFLFWTIIVLNLLLGIINAIFIMITFSMDILHALVVFMF